MRWPHAQMRRQHSCLLQGLLVVVMISCGVFLRRAPSTLAAGTTMLDDNVASTIRGGSWPCAWFKSTPCEALDGSICDNCQEDDCSQCSIACPKCLATNAYHQSCRGGYTGFEFCGPASPDEDGCGASLVATCSDVQGPLPPFCGCDSDRTGEWCPQRRVNLSGDTCAGG
jgi:hypothetical protein